MWWILSPKGDMFVFTVIEFLNEIWQTFRYKWYWLQIYDKSSETRVTVSFKLTKYKYPHTNQGTLVIVDLISTMLAHARRVICNDTASIFTRKRNHCI